MMTIRKLGPEEELPIQLLLEADPSEELIKSYTDAGEVFIAETADQPIGVCVLLALSSETAEIKNIAVAKTERGKGIGKAMIQYVLSEADRSGFISVEIGTGNSSLNQLALYQKCGFRLQSIDRDFFVRNYPEPIFENGIQCRDMVRLEFKL